MTTSPLTTPDLIVAGAQKCGTTSMHAYLRAHPGLAMSEPKEPHVLAYCDGDDDALEAYRDVFPDDAGDRVRVETGTEYLILPGIPERIRRVCGQVRLAFLFRNPIDRAWSQYRWLTSLGIERRPFRVAFEADRREVPDVATDIRGHMRYYWSHGAYGRHLTRFLSEFDRDEVLILSTDQLEDRPVETLHDVMRHAGVDPIDVPVDSREYVTRSLRFPRTTHLLYGHEVVHHGRRDLPGRLLLGCQRIVATTRGVHGVSRRLAARLERMVRPEPLLSDADRRWIASFYADDVAILRALTGLPFTAWARDFPSS